MNFCVEKVTAEKVKSYFGGMIIGDVMRYKLPILHRYRLSATGLFPVVSPLH